MQVTRSDVRQGEVQATPLMLSRSRLNPKKSKVWHTISNAILIRSSGTSYADPWLYELGMYDASIAEAPRDDADLRLFLLRARGPPAEDRGEGMGNPQYRGVRVTGEEDSSYLFIPSILDLAHVAG